MLNVTERTIMASIIQRPRPAQTRVPSVVYVLAAILVVVGVATILLRTAPLFAERSSQIVPARPSIADVALTPTDLPPQ